MKEEFRVRFGAVINEFVIPLLLCLVLLVPFSYRKNAWVLYLIVLFAIVKVLQRSVPLLRSRLIIDENHFRLLYGEHNIALSWEEIEIVSIDKKKKDVILSISTVDDCFTIPINYYESNKIVELIRNYAKSTAFDENAYKKLPCYSEFKTEMESLLNGVIVIKDDKFLSIIGWGTIVFSIAVSIIAYLSDGGITPLFLLLFTLLGLVIVLNIGVTEMTSLSITRKTIWGTNRLNWDEIKLIQISPFGEGIVLNNGKKQLSIPGGLYWEKVNRERNLSIFSELAKKHEIKIEENKFAAYKRTKNCRAK